MKIQTIDILEQADKFLDVALYCIGPDYNDGFYVGESIISDNELMKYLFPKEEVTAIVNCAFGCELYLKAMRNSGSVVRGHHLDKLFKNLDGMWKKVIIKLMEYEKRDIFDCFLMQASNAFEEWRYVYEKEDEEKSFYFLFIKKFVFVLKRVAYSKYYYEQNDLEKVDKEVLELLLE